MWKTLFIWSMETFSFTAHMLAAGYSIINTVVLHFNSNLFYSTVCSQVHQCDISVSSCSNKNSLKHNIRYLSYWVTVWQESQIKEEDRPQKRTERITHLEMFFSSGRPPLTDWINHCFNFPHSSLLQSVTSLWCVKDVSHKGGCLPTVAMTQIQLPAYPGMPLDFQSQLSCPSFNWFKHHEKRLT